MKVWNGGSARIGRIGPWRPRIGGNTAGDGEQDGDKMADLKEAADQFAKDLTGMNIAGLMMAFTPNGMAKAMAMQQEMMASAAGAPPPQAGGYELIVGDTEGGLTAVDLVLKNDSGSVTIATKWQDVAGAWKVEDIGLKSG